MIYPKVLALPSTISSSQNSMGRLGRWTHIGITPTRCLGSKPKHHWHKRRWILPKNHEIEERIKRKYFLREKEKQNIPFRSADTIRLPFTNHLAHAHFLTIEIFGLLPRSLVIMEFSILTSEWFKEGSLMFGQVLDSKHPVHRDVTTFFEQILPATMGWSILVLIKGGEGPQNR